MNLFEDMEFHEHVRDLLNSANEGHEEAEETLLQMIWAVVIEWRYHGHVRQS